MTHSEILKHDVYLQKVKRMKNGNYTVTVAFKGAHNHWFHFDIKDLNPNVARCAIGEQTLDYFLRKKVESRADFEYYCRVSHNDLKEWLEISSNDVKYSDPYSEWIPL